MTRVGQMYYLLCLAAQSSNWIKMDIFTKFHQAEASSGPSVVKPVVHMSTSNLPKDKVCLTISLTAEIIKIGPRFNPPFPLSLSLTHTHVHTHAHTNTPTLTHTHTSQRTFTQLTRHMPPPSLSLSNTHAHIQAHKHASSHTFTRMHICPVFISLKTRTHTHPPTLPLSFSLSRQL